MKKTIPHILLFFLLIFSAGCTQTQNTMKIPLTEGNENSSVKIENTTVEIVRLYIQDKPYSDHSFVLSAELNISENDRQYTTSLGYWKSESHIFIEDYPKAFGRYLYGLEINDTETKPQVFLTIERNDFGKPFFLELNQETTIDSLTVHFSSVINEWSEYAPDEPAFCDTEISFKLSENNQQQTLSFMATKLHEKGNRPFYWKNYQIYVLNYSETSLQLNIEKK